MSAATAPDANSTAYEGVPEDKKNELHLARTKTNEPHYDLPDKKTVDEAGEMMIQDESGKEFPFKELYQNKKGQQLIVFIRHFFCGVRPPPYSLNSPNSTTHLTIPAKQNCEQYVQALAKDLPPQTLHSTTPPTTMTIIGCGQPAPIPSYRDRTLHSFLNVDNSYPIYCDPHRTIYKKLNMTENLQQGDTKPEYIKRGSIENALGSIKNAVAGGGQAVKGGSVSQNGGEWLFANGELVWARRMRHTADHAEVGELKEVLGLE